MNTNCSLLIPALRAIPKGQRERFVTALAKSGIIRSPLISAKRPLTAADFDPRGLNRNNLLKAVHIFNSSPSGARIRLGPSSISIVRSNSTVDILSRVETALESGVLPKRAELQSLLEEAKLFLLENPAHRGAMLLEARINIEVGYIDRAERTLRELVVTDQTDPAARVVLARALVLKGNFLATSSTSLMPNEAYLAYSEALRLDPENADAAAFRLRVAKKIGDQKLIREAAICLLAMREDAEARELLGTATISIARGYAEQERYDLVLLLLDEAARTGMRRTEAMLLRASALSSVGRREEALDVLGEISPGDAEEKMQVSAMAYGIHMRMAGEAEDRGDLTAALRSLEEALLIRQAGAAAKQRALVLFRLKRYKEANEFLAFLKSTGERDIDVLEALGETYLVLKRTSDAIRTFDQILLTWPGDARALYGKGRALFFQGKFQDSSYYLKRALRTFPEAGELLARGERFSEIVSSEGASRPPDLADIKVNELRILAFVFKSKGSYDLADECWDKVLELVPDDAEALMSKARNHYRNGRYDDAEARLRRLVSSHPDYQRAFSFLVYLLKKRGKLRDAAAVIDERLKTRTDDVEAFLEAAMMLKRIGKLEGAREYFERALNIDPENHFARLRLIKLLLKSDDPQDRKEIIVHCEEGLKIAPGMLNYRYERASAYLSLRRRQEAIELFLDLDRQIEDIEDKGHETRGKWLWTRLRLADAHLDLRDFDGYLFWTSKAKELMAMIRDEISLREARKLLNGMEERWLAHMRVS